MSLESRLPRFDVMVSAMRERDPAYDGVFFVCVRSTRVFCRTTCRARLPAASNVEFVATPDEALAAGYRPCRKCCPDAPPESHPLWARTLIERIRSSDERLTDERLRDLGLSPARVRSYFRRRTGMTFHAFQRSMRMGEALCRLDAGADATSTGLDVGYGSLSGFRTAFVGEFGRPPGQAIGMHRLVADEIDSPLRPLLAVASDRGICMLEFQDRQSLATVLRALRARFGSPIVPGANAHTTQLRAELAAYFAGELSRFSVALDLGGTPFQQQVWQRLLAIPPGETVSYSEVARDIERPAAVRAVARANGQNPVVIVVPCHRVIRADGHLCGYGGGLWRKRWLLDLERRGRISA